MDGSGAPWPQPAACVRLRDAKGGGDGKPGKERIMHPERGAASVVTGRPGGGAGAACHALLLILRSRIRGRAGGEDLVPEHFTLGGVRPEGSLVRRARRIGKSCCCTGPARRTQPERGETSRGDTRDAADGGASVQGRHPDGKLRRCGGGSG
jgi:hypothetical protein